MKVIWKYPLEPLGISAILMPKGAKILCAQPQVSGPMIWALVEATDEKELEMREFVVIGTGQPMHDECGSKATYIGTWQDPPFVWHLFEKVKGQL